jgi:hypothetical protein
METIHGGDGMQGDPYDSDNLHVPERITHERRKMDGGIDHETSGGHAWAMAIMKHTGP